jgi:hypothetical protein
MSETYPPGGYAPDRMRPDRLQRDGLQRDGMERAGLVILLVTGFVAAVLVLAGLVYAAGTPARHNAAVIAAGCEPSLFILGLPCITQQLVISQYQAIENPAIRQLTADTAAYQASERQDLAAAEAALSAEVAAEQTLDNNLAAMAFTPQNQARSLRLITGAEMIGNPVPPAAVTFTPQQTTIANALLRADQALASLTAQQARSTTLTQLRSFNPKTAAAGAAVQTQMNLLRKAVKAPLPG